MVYLGTHWSPYGHDADEANVANIRFVVQGFIQETQSLSIEYFIMRMGELTT